MAEGMGGSERAVCPMVSSRDILVVTCVDQPKLTPREAQSVSAEESGAESYLHN